jgi:hypothetical protein
MVVLGMTIHEFACYNALLRTKLADGRFPRGMRGGCADCPATLTAVGSVSG